MSAIADAAEELRRALQEAAAENGWGVSTDQAEPGPRPACVIGPPALQWEAGCPGPTSARFLIYTVVDASARAVEQLWELVPAMAGVIDSTTDAVVIESNPAAYVVGTTELPCYETMVEVSLQ